ncbi:hypothetical protein BB561_003537 [Smittium simulii]|uniref:C2H2-type domain-containing protein n=1 Tax=Smittium simulii TaxID=133385 RepID=A0A2T9YKR0_9FUNG|nr:hypothetical protein BB561_003537 [Smittium simulii]
MKKKAQEQLFSLELPPIQRKSDFRDNQTLPSFVSLGFDRDFEKIRFCCCCLSTFLKKVRTPSIYNFQLSHSNKHDLKALSEHLRSHISNQDSSSPNITHSPIIQSSNSSRKNNTFNLLHSSPEFSEAIENKFKSDLSFITNVNPPLHDKRFNNGSIDDSHLHLNDILMTQKSLPSNSSKESLTNLSFFDNTKHNYPTLLPSQKSNELVNPLKIENKNTSNSQNKQNKQKCFWMKCNQEFTNIEDLLIHLYQLHVEESQSNNEPKTGFLNIILDIISSAGDIGVLEQKMIDKNSNIKTPDLGLAIKKLKTSHTESIFSNSLELNSSNNNTVSQLALCQSYSNDNQTNPSSDTDNKNNSINKNDIKSEFDSESKAIDCKWTKCSKSIPNTIELIKHLLEKHLNKVSYLCLWKECKISLNSLVDLSDHISQEHIGSGQKTYICYWKDCERQGKPFLQRQRAIRHIQMHTGYKPYICEKCNKRFLESHIKDQHVRTHTGEKPYKCDYENCGKKFASSSALKIHKRTHTGERPYICNFKGCNKRFAESSNLVKHTRVHTGERPFSCSYLGCLKTFSRHDQLNRHLKTHHQTLKTID